MNNFNYKWLYLPIALLAILLVVVSVSVQQSGFQDSRDNLAQISIKGGYPLGSSRGGDPVPLVNLQASVNGSTVILNWITQYVNACFATGDWSGLRPVNGTETLNNVSEGLRIFSLHCVGLGKVTSSEVRVTVGQNGGDSVTLIGAGDIADSGPRDTLTADLLGNILQDNPSAVIFTAGDNAYPDGSPADFNNYFEPTWGLYKDRILFPAVGNHEFGTPNATGYREYFGSLALGDSDESAGQMFYARDLGDWRIIVLDSQARVTVGSPQYNWLQRDLRDNPRDCVMAIMHQPLFNIGRSGNSEQMRPLWELLYAAKADVMVVGHDHTYQRWAKQNPYGDREDDRGIQEFIVGTGGVGLRTFETINDNVLAKNNVAQGVIEFTLRENSYDWQFHPITGHPPVPQGQTVNDSGTESCVI